MRGRYIHYRDLMSTHLSNHRGFIQLPLLVTIIGLVFFLMITAGFSFKNQLFGTIFEKPQSMAASPFVTRNGKDLYLNGSKFRSVGVNRYNILTTGGNPYVGCGGNFSNAELAAWFDELDQMNVTSVRFWLFQSFTKSGTDFARFDYLISLADQHGIKLVPVLENQWSDCTQGGYKYNNWYQTGYKSPYGSYPISLREYTQRVVTRYKDSTAIMMWQIINEGETKDGSGGQYFTDFYNFAKDISTLIKSIDQNHLVSLGTMGSGQPSTGGSWFRQLHQLETIDVIEYHDYNQEQTAVPTSLASRLTDSTDLQKPLLIGEAGAAAPCTGVQSGFTCFSTPVRADLMQQKMNEFFNRGGQVYMLWSYRDKSSAPVAFLDFTMTDPLANVVKTTAASLGNAEITPGPTASPITTPTNSASPTSSPSSSSLKVESLTLVNAVTGQDIATLTYNSTINLAQTGSQLSVRANTSPSSVGSVVFTLDNNAPKLESFAPYTINGDNEDGSYNSWTPSVGMHSLTVRPYTEPQGLGTAGMPITVLFTVVSGGSIPPSPTLTVRPTNTPGNRQTDVTGDGKVNLFDYNAVVSTFNQIGPNLKGDVDKNEKVDLFDYNLVVADFDQTN